MTSCCKEDLATTFGTPDVDVYVSIENRIQNDLEKQIETGLLYNWSKSDGDLYYSHGPELVYGNIIELNGDKTFSENFNTFEHNIIHLDLNKQYSIYLFSDKNLACEPIDVKSTFDFNYKFDSIKQCKEYYAGYKHRFNNAERIIVEMIPVSYVYIFQLIIYDDDKNIEMNAKSIEYMGLNGVAKNFDLMAFKPSDELGVIESFETKNIQYYNDFGVVAERFVTFGITQDENSSWNNVDGVCELGVSLKMKDGSIKNGKINIYNEMSKKPQGGLINIVIKNSEISVKTETDEGFDINVGNWENHEIYIDF